MTASKSKQGMNTTTSSATKPTTAKPKAPATSAALSATKTPKSEVEEQHREAGALIDTMPYAELHDHGEIPIEWKQHPTQADTSYSAVEAGLSGIKGANPMCSARISLSEHMYSNPCVSSRGQVDIEPLADLIRNGHNTDAIDDTANSLLLNMWSEETAAKENVHIVRPSHDAWGIKKLVLMFSDDFLQTVYEMPWWHSKPEMRAAIEPILKVLNLSHEEDEEENVVVNDGADEPSSENGIGLPNNSKTSEKSNKKSKRIVRMLLASLPPGVTIPIHHDTGEWVRHTHRVHVPVITNEDKVLFRVGPTEQTMERIRVHPGHVFEMNNQAKHAVSNHWDNYRVHLILDYVDESFGTIQRIPLNPGERLLQTRRSIDRESDCGKRVPPTFCIIGAQKAGTTSLYDYMNQHPLIIRARRRETHCLDWRWNTKCVTTMARKEYCTKFFYAKELLKHPSLLTGDSTPSYLVSPDLVIPRMKECFPWIKMIVMLRNPIKRSHSQYAMVTSQDGTEQQLKIRGTEWLKKNFETVVKEDILAMKDIGLIPYWKIPNDKKDDEDAWFSGEVDYEIFEKFAGSPEEEKAWSEYQKGMPMMTGSHSLVARGMYELQIRQWFKHFDRDQFLVLKLEDMAVEGGVQRCVRRAFKHVGLPPDYRVQDVSPKNARSYNPMCDQTKALLERFYAPHNRRLEAILGEEWKNAWGY
eukprot:CAMPEP_0116015152 /NCGR_PEP_ID=MMETSP0321-20121206/6672_1 /TAXON_ID=163516 /ORGANISM="Leptocylindrus danicus var. danicus, Strain B650" /LENGTH=697 /DNA_ID=CAMNT_0003484879 /DNA_START=77 /DNA_END=2173 /DNA_ORIENTATION=-